MTYDENRISDLIDGGLHEQSRISDEMIEEKVIQMFDEESHKMLILLIRQAAKEAVKANATDLDLSAEINVGDSRYKASVKITVDRIGEAAYKPSGINLTYK